MKIEELKQYDHERYLKNKSQILKQQKARYHQDKVYRETKIKKSAIWRKENPEKVKIFAKNWIKDERAKMRKIILEHYGKKCSCCGESIERFLSIDHINNDGNIQRKKFKNQDQYYRWIIQNDFPKDLQVLCMNCNFGKSMNNGICPHKEENKFENRRA